MNNLKLAFSAIFKEEYLDRLILRNEEFRKLFQNMNKFLIENFKFFEVFGKSLQKISYSLEDYIKKYTPDDKNCYFLAKTFSNTLNTFGEDSSKLFHSLSSDINNTLTGVIDCVSMNRRNHLDLLAFTLTSYNNLEMEYLKILAKYKTYSREADDSLLNYHESLKEAKTIYNLSIMNRSLSKVQKIVTKTMKYESKLKSSISQLNSKRKELAGVIIESMTNFKSCYKFCLAKFFEISKKNFDALSSFMSLFSQTLQQKKEMIRKLEVPENLLPNPEEFKFASQNIDNELFTENKEKLKLSTKELRKQTSMIKPSKWPDFLENPDKVSDINVLDYYDWIQTYMEKFFQTCMERRKILKHVKKGVKDLADEHEIISKSLLKNIKNVTVTASWNTFGEQLFAISQGFGQLFDIIIKKMFGFSNFTQIKVGVFESVLMDIEKNIKISYSTALQTLKDHGNVRNPLLKMQSSRSNKKTQSEIAMSARKSMNETANNLKAIIEEMNKEEQKRIEFIKENLIMVFSQMEYYFEEIFDYLKLQNEKYFQEMNSTFQQETESLFYKLIFSDSKMNELFKSKYNDIILIERDNDIEFNREFDPDSNPLYLKIIQVNDKSQNNNTTLNNDKSKNPEKDAPLDAPLSNRGSIQKLELKKESQGKIDLGTQKSLSQESFIKDPNQRPENQKEEQRLNSVNSLQKSNENLDESEKKASISNFDSPMLRRKSLESNENFSQGLMEDLSHSVRFKSIKPVKCDEVLENNNEASSDLEKKNQGNNDFEFTKSPKKKKSTYSFFRNKFGLTQGEMIYSVFSCALSDKMLVQGKMFISNKKIGFHSYFNKHTFIGETKMIIPKNDIIRIEKRINALIFDNSIAIITPRGELFFTSFVFRDKAYISIIKSIKPPEQRDLASILNENNQHNNFRIKKNSIDNLNNLEEKKEIMPFNQSPSNNIQANPVPAEFIIDQALLKKLEGRARLVKEVAPKDDFFTDQEFKIKVPSFIQRVEDVYRILFSNDTIRFRGKDYHGFWEYLKVVKSEDIEFSMTPLEPHPPNFYKNSENPDELVSYPYFSERKVVFTHPVRNTGIPFMPKTCPVKDLQKIYWISNTEFRMVGDVKSEKIPYADCFYICVMYIVRQLEDKTIEIICKFRVVWVKSTVLKGTIEKRVTAETVEVTNAIVLPSFIEFLKSVYPSNEYQSKFAIVKKGDNENAGNKEGVLVAAQNRNEEQIEELTTKIEECKKEITALQGKTQRNQNIIIVFVGIYSLHMLYQLISYFLI